MSADDTMRAAAREWYQEQRGAGRPILSPAALSSVAAKSGTAEHFPLSRASTRGPKSVDAGQVQFGRGLEPLPWREPDPIVSALPPVKRLDPDMLPSVLSAFIFDVSERQQSPADFVAVACLCGLGSMIGNLALIRPKALDDWTIVPNLWGACVGNPSSMKSPTQGDALAPVYELQDELRKAWERDRRDDDIDAALASLSAKDANKKALHALKTGDRDTARELLKTGTVDADETPCPRLIVSDATVEKLGELLAENPRGLLLRRDELPGLLARLDRNEFQSERAFYLEAFNGNSPYVFDRIGRGTINIPALTLSMIGGIQPSRIAPIVRGAVSGSGDDGLLQRLQMTVWPDHPKEWRYVDRRPNDSAKGAYREAFRRVHNFTSGRSEPAVFGFAARAQELFREWYEAIQREARSGSVSTALESHLLKMPKTVASLALIFHLVEGGDGPVSAEATGRALDWADYLRSHADRLYSCGTVAVEDAARLIISRRKTLPPQFGRRDVQRKGWSGLAEHADVTDAIDLLESTGHVRKLVTGPAPDGGRPATAYEWHPSLVIGG